MAPESHCISAGEVLAFLERNATQVIIQTIPNYRRAKNRVILSYRDSFGRQQVCGGYTVADAVMKAQQRNQRYPTANGLAIPKAEAPAIASGRKA